MVQMIPSKMEHREVVGSRSSRNKPPENMTETLYLIGVLRNQNIKTFVACAFRPERANFVL